MTTKSKLIDFSSARRGMHLIDTYNQVCRVEGVSRKYGRVTTRRLEGRKWWDECATWTPEAFNGRKWWLWRRP